MNTSRVDLIKEALQQNIVKKHISDKDRFFKTHAGSYAEHDVFIGVPLPVQRTIAQTHKDLTLSDIKTLLISPIHEERSVALILLVQRFRATKTTSTEKEDIISFYLEHTAHVNNWDLVDISCSILGEFLYATNKGYETLFTLAKSTSLWEQRIAIVATQPLIKKGVFEPALTISTSFLTHSHDLIHKATGWMLREVGKKDIAQLETFLAHRYKQMPRTMLRYAIEKFPEQRRKQYLNGQI